MNLHDLVWSLEPHVFRSLVNACVARVTENIKDLPMLTDAERVLAGVSRVKAIKCVMDRTGMRMSDAKDSVDREVPRDPDPDPNGPKVTIVRKPGNDRPGTDYDGPNFGRNSSGPNLQPIKEK